MVLRRKNGRIGTIAVGLALLVVYAGTGWANDPQPGVDKDGVLARRIAISVDETASEGDLRVAESLRKRLLQRRAREVSITKGAPGDQDLIIALGRTGDSGQASALARARNIALPGSVPPAPESFAVRTISLNGQPGILALGADERGLLYAAGEIVRQSHPEPDAVRFTAIDVNTAPAFRFRGFSTNQGGTMRRVTKARPWTQEEVFACVQDYALAGANCFYTEDDGGPLFDYVKSFDLMTVTGVRPNEMKGDFPADWKAGGREAWEGNHWVCPSLPEARQALMEQWRADFAKRAQHDIMRMYAGDPGGCTDERCTPWGKTFVYLCEEVARRWLEGHPNSIVLVANQGVDNAGDQAILDYFNEAPRDWCYGLCYGPGSNAMSHYFRDKLRDDLFVYPGQGPVNRYLAELFHQLPRDKRIVHYSDITHWISAQYMVEHPEPNIMKAYGRRTFHARPKALYDIFQRIMPFSEGDIIYSEGYHDEFNQYLWCRLLWNPNRSLEDVTMEYCRLHFGEEAAERMMQALFQLEENLEQPLAANDGIDRYYQLVKEAGETMPLHFMENNYRWRLHMQKAALDRYFQLKLRIEVDKESRIRDMLSAGLASDKLKNTIDDALDVLREPAETPEMAALREEAGHLGDETDRLFGVRNVGYFKMDISLRGLDAEQNIIEKAKVEKSKKEKRRLLTVALERIGEPTRPGNIFW